jgi:hypothetical protein
MGINGDGLYVSLRGKTKSISTRPVELLCSPAAPLENNRNQHAKEARWGRGKRMLGKRVLRKCAEADCSRSSCKDLSGFL